MIWKSLYLEEDGTQEERHLMLPDDRSPREPRRHGTLRLALIVTLMPALLPVGMGQARATGAPHYFSTLAEAVVPTAASPTVVYQNAAFGYSVSYPADWVRVKAVDAQLRIRTADGGAEFRGNAKGSITSQSASDLRRILIGMVTSNGHVKAGKSAYSTQSIGNVRFGEASATVQEPRGQAVQVRALATFREHTIYSFYTACITVANGKPRSGASGQARALGRIIESITITGPRLVAIPAAATSTKSPSPTETPTATSTASLTATPSATLTPSSTPTVSPSFTATPLPTSTTLPLTPTPPPTATPVLPMGVSSGSQILTDSDFSAGPDTIHWPSGPASYANGRYILVAAGGFYRTATTGSNLADGAISATLSLTGTGHAGVVARETVSTTSGNSMYVLEIATNGEVCLLKDVLGNWTALHCQDTVGWVDATGDNVLTLQVMGSSMSAVVNNHVFDTYADPQPLGPGNWGVMADAPDNAATVGRFARVTVYQAP